MNKDFKFDRAVGLIREHGLSEDIYFKILKDMIENNLLNHLIETLFGIHVPNGTQQDPE